MSETSVAPSTEAFPLEVRPIVEESELAMVAANWKADLFDESKYRMWGKGLRESDFWRLANFAVDKCAIPTSQIFAAVHPDNRNTAIAWCAVREGTMLFRYLRGRLRHDHALAEKVESELLKKLPILAIRIHDFNPFCELER